MQVQTYTNSEQLDHHHSLPHHNHIHAWSGRRDTLFIRFLTGRPRPTKKRSEERCCRRSAAGTCKIQRSEHDCRVQPSRTSCLSKNLPGSQHLPRGFPIDVKLVLENQHQSQNLSPELGQVHGRLQDRNCTRLFVSMNCSASCFYII